MLTRLVRTQLVIFSIASVIGLALMIVVYMQAPTMLGIGRMTVTLQLPTTGGLYRFSNVTYRGVQIGRVTSVRPTRSGAEATLSLDTSPQIPADLQASVLSVSAVGEQYVDLQPRTRAGPYLEDGSVIAAKDAIVPQAVGPMLDQVSALLSSIPKDRLADLLDDSFKGLNGSDYDLSRLLDSSSKLAGDFHGVAKDVRALVDDGRPLLDGQQASTDAVRTWARSLAGITDQLHANDPQVRALLQNGPGAADEASQLFKQVEPTLPVLLANLTTIGQIAVTYHPSIEQLLVLLPPYIASRQSIGVSKNNPTGMAMGDFTLTVSDPPACTVGFLPPSSWRSPADESEADTPDGLYCKLPQDSPIGVRGARNYPCLGQPGKRAPTVEICEGDKPFEPLAMRQHSIGAYPIDPNLVSQGVPPDDRATLGDDIYGPVDGTPLPEPAQAGPGAAPEPEPAIPDVPTPPDSIPPDQDDGAASAAPSAFHPSISGPSVAIATYDPASGRYATPDGTVYRQTDLVKPAGGRTWRDLLPTT